VCWSNLVSIGVAYGKARSRLHFIVIIIIVVIITRSVHQRGAERYGSKQERSYHKQIARQLRTQYVEGIYRPKYYTVILKSKSKVTQGHWKRNHWVDHTRLTISPVIWRWIYYYCDLEMWVRGHSRSLKWGTVSYSPSIVTVARICSRSWGI